MPGLHVDLALGLGHVEVDHAGSSARPAEYATNAASQASMHDAMSRAARTSASRRIRTGSRMRAAYRGRVVVGSAQHGREPDTGS